MRLGRSSSTEAVGSPLSGRSAKPNRDTERLRGLDDALRAIRVGTFGRCIECDMEIPLSRLEAIPWSPRCVRCQETAEMQSLGCEEADEGMEGGSAFARGG